MRFAGWQRGRRAVEEIARVRFAEVYTIIVPRVACEVLSVAVLKLYSPCTTSTVCMPIDTPSIMFIYE